jgi:hypothetical protein
MEYVLEEIGKRQFEVKPIIAAATWEELKTNMQTEVTTNYQ